MFPRLRRIRPGWNSPCNRIRLKFVYFCLVGIIILWCCAFLFQARFNLFLGSSSLERPNCDMCNKRNAYLNRKLIDACYRCRTVFSENVYRNNLPKRCHNSMDHAFLFKCSKQWGGKVVKLIVGGAYTSHVAIVTRCV